MRQSNFQLLKSFKSGHVHIEQEHMRAIAISQASKITQIMLEETFFFRIEDNNPDTQPMMTPWLILYHKGTGQILKSIIHPRMVDLDVPKCKVYGIESEDPLLLEDQRTGQYRIGKNLIVEFPSDHEDYWQTVCLSISREEKAVPLWNQRTPTNSSLHPIWIMGNKSVTHDLMYLTSQTDGRFTLIRLMDAMTSKVICTWPLKGKFFTVGCYATKSSWSLSDVRVMLYRPAKFSVCLYRFQNPQPLSEWFLGSKQKIPEDLYEPFSGPSGHLQLKMRVNGHNEKLVHVSLTRLEGEEGFSESDSYIGEAPAAMTWTFDSSSQKFIGHDEEHVAAVEFEERPQSKFWDAVESSANSFNIGLNN